jgi:hypothetical protein
MSKGHLQFLQAWHRAVAGCALRISLGQTYRAFCNKPLGQLSTDDSDNNGARFSFLSFVITHQAASLEQASHERSLAVGPSLRKPRW